MELKVLAEKKSGYWIATCLELNIVVQADTPQKLLSKMGDALDGYVRAVTETDDALSIPSLMNRPAPMSKFFKFWLASKIRQYHNWKATFIDPPHIAIAPKAA